MSKERLKEIQEKYDMWADDFNLDPQDVEWLIKQAERVRELEVWYHSYHKEAKLNNILKIQNKRYREALEFYAEQDNYRWETSYRPQQEIDCMVIDDGGHTARKALEC